ncbi:MAG TPA: Nif11-like leader peptide family natural product precursor [Candidatus Acidoferrales bacterium]|nr:Nif11-like leader peptide family natural product precursor [Candidatus Acidoferrales bacterium]
MSAEALKKFAEALEKDPKLRAALVKQAKSATDKVVAIAKKRGYHFTKAELHAHVKKAWGAKKMPSSADADPFTCFCF